MLNKEHNNDEKVLVIYGCGGHARSIVNAVRSMNENKKIILVDENAKAGEIILQCEVVVTYSENNISECIVGIGDNEKRKVIFEKMIRSIGKKVTSVISSSASIGLGAKIGIGTFVAANAYIGPEVIVGDDVVINTSSIVEHEVTIGSHTHVAPNATICGRSIIGNNVFCGAGSTVIDSIKICDNVIIGAGAVVTRDIDVPGVYVGVPAKRVSPTCIRHI